MISPEKAWSTRLGRVLSREEIQLIRIFWQTIPMTLNALAVASLIVLSLKILVFNHIPEWFRGAHEFGLVFESLLASVLASYIFYLIVIHLKETRDIALVYPHISKWARRVVGDCESLLQEISKHSGVDLGLSSITEKAITGAFKNTNPQASAPMLIAPGSRHVTWLEYFIYKKNRSKNALTKLLSQIKFLDAALVSMLTAIDDSAHFMSLEMLAHIPFQNQDMLAFTSTFYKYCIECRRLKTQLESSPIATN